MTTPLPPMRLTRRGVVVVSILLVAALVGCFAIGELLW